MHPRPDWFNLLKNAVLKLIVCIGVMTFTYSGYLIPIALDQIQVGHLSYLKIDVVLLSTLCLASLVVFVVLLGLLAVQYSLLMMEDKICCGIFAVTNIGLAYLSIMVAVDSGPIGMGQFWETVGQCYIWLLALLCGLLPIALLLYCLALVWLSYESQSSGGTADGQPMAVVVIAGKSTTAGTPGTRVAPGTRAAPGSAATHGSTAASRAT